MFKQKFTTRTLTTLAMLIAIEVILSRFLSISMWNTKIGFSFLPIAAAGILYGPLAAGAVGGSWGAGAAGRVRAGAAWGP